MGGSYCATGRGVKVDVARPSLVDYGINALTRTHQWGKLGSVGALCILNNTLQTTIKIGQYFG